MRDAFIGMTSNVVDAGAAVSKSESLLAPLPTLTLATQCVEKLDAGLRSLDHCEQLLCCVSQR